MYICSVCVWMCLYRIYWYMYMHVYLMCMCSLYILIGLCLYMCIYMYVYNVCECVHVYARVCVHMCLYLSLPMGIWMCIILCVSLWAHVCMCALDRCPWVYHAPALGPIDASQLSPGLWSPEFCRFSLFPYFATVDTGVQSTLSVLIQPYTRRLGLLGLLWSGCCWTEFFCGSRSQPSSQGGLQNLI